MSKECQRCGKDIVSGRNNFYCSKKCSSSVQIAINGRKRLPRQNCRNCGIKCPIPASVYCCRNCVFEHNLSPTAKTISVCEICSHDFLRSPLQTLMKCDACKRQRNNELKRLQSKVRHNSMSPEELLIQKERQRAYYQAAKIKKGTYINKARTFPKRYFEDVVRRAKTRKFDIDITMSDIIIQIIRQKGMCALSGRKISLSDRTASLDRINSDLGYTKTNIQWVHKMINCMKMHFPESEFIQACKDIASYRA